MVGRTRSGLVAAGVLAIVASVAPPTAADAPGAAPARLAPDRAGEEWYGSVSWGGRGSVRVSDGVYVSHDSHRVAAPTTSDKVTITSTIDSKITRPDPDPANDGCWAQLETWSGTGTTEGYFQVIDAGAQYQIAVYSTTQLVVNHEVHYGGMIGTSACSDGDLQGPESMFPFARIYSRQHKDDSFRYGKQQGPSLETTQGCSNSGANECTEALFFLHNPPTEATWNITKKDCTGYSKAYRLGKDETAFVFSPCQTKSVSARTSFLHEFAGVPKICKLLYIGKVAAPCKVYKTVTAVEWLQNDFFLSNAAGHDKCGIWVVDKSGALPTKIRPAHGTGGLDVPWVTPGKPVPIKGPNGTVTVSC